MRIEIISGSTRKESITARLAIFLRNYFNENTSHSIGIIDVREWEMPPYNQGYYTLEETPEKFHQLWKRYNDADAIILVSPEYNGSYSPGLQNLMDHFPRPKRKVIGVATATTGGLGGMRAAQQLILLVTAMFAFPSPQLLITSHVDKKIDPNGVLVDTAFMKHVQLFFEEFLWFAERITHKNE